MTGDAPVTDKAIKTPVYAEENSWEVTTIYDANGAPLCVLSLRHFPVAEEDQDEWERRQKAKAAFIVVAVNSYDESRALLKEFLEVCERESEKSSWSDNDNEVICWDARAARIRAHLGEGK